MEILSGTKKNKENNNMINYRNKKPIYSVYDGKKIETEV